MKRYGIFGGTFNPPHIGHLILAEDIRQQLSLDKVVFIPSGVPPLKDSVDVSDYRHRYKMSEIAFLSDSNFEVSDIEYKDCLSAKKSYTVETLIKLHEQYKNDFIKLFLIIGIDNLIDFPRWKNPNKLFALSEVFVMNRPGFTIHDAPAEYSSKVKYLKVPSLEISSSDIRKRVKEGKSIKYLVLPEIEKYISVNKLYK